MPEGFSWGELLLSFDLLLPILSSFLSGYTRDVIPGFSWSNRLLVLLAYYHWFIRTLFFVLLHRSASFSSYFFEMLNTGYLTNNVSSCRSLSRICKKKTSSSRKKEMCNCAVFIRFLEYEMRNRNEVEMNKMAWLLFLRILEKLKIYLLISTDTTTLRKDSDS